MNILSISWAHPEQYNVSLDNRMVVQSKVEDSFQYLRDEALNNAGSASIQWVSYLILSTVH